MTPELGVFLAMCPPISDSMLELSRFPAEAQSTRFVCIPLARPPGPPHLIRFEVPPLFQHLEYASLLFYTNRLMTHKKNLFFCEGVILGRI